MVNCFFIFPKKMTLSLHRKMCRKACRKVVVCLFYMLNIMICKFLHIAFFFLNKIDYFKSSNFNGYHGHKNHQYFAAICSNYPYNLQCSRESILARQTVIVFPKMNIILVVCVLTCEAYLVITF